MHSKATLHTLLLRLLPLSIVLSLLAAGALPAVQAAGGATIRDDVGLFTQAGRARINSAASDANLRIVVITNKQSFPTKADWQSWLRSQATDPNAITIGLHVLPNEPPGPRRQQIISAVPGSNTHLSQAQADQAVADSRSTFNQVGVTAGVVALINEFKAMGATSPGSGGSSGSVLDWLVPVIIVLALAYLAVRLLSRRRRAMSGPYGQFGAPHQGYNQGYGGPGFGGPGFGGGGGGFGRGLLGGLLGGLGGAWLGNQLFGDRGSGNANAAGYDPNSGTYDPNSGPTDTPEAQSLQGGWNDNSGGADSGSGWDAGSGDSGGGWDAGGGDSGGGWDSGGSDSGGGWS